MASAYSYTKSAEKPHATSFFNPFSWYSRFNEYREYLGLPNPGKFEMLHGEVKNTFLTNYAFDGAQANIIKELSPNFHVQHQFSLGSQVAPPMYNFMAGYITERTQLNGTMDSDTNMNATFKHMWTPRMATKIVTQLTHTPGHSMVQVEQDYVGSDFSANIKAMNPSPIDNTGLLIASYLQSVTPRLALGTELVIQRPTPEMEETAMSYVAKYSGPNYIATAQLQGMGAIQASYFQTINEKVDFGVELNMLLAGPRREAVATVGGKFDFRQATFRGQIDTSGRVSAVLEEKMAPGFSFLISGDLDHMKGQSKFGVGIMFKDPPSVRLRKATVDGNLFAVRRLIAKVDNVQNEDPENGWTTLMYAARYGHAELVRYLLDIQHEEHDLSMDYQGTSVLMVAAEYGHDEVFAIYAQYYPASIHAVNQEGKTVLLVAARKGNNDLINYLLDLGSDVDHTDDEGNTALHYASAWGNIQCMETLVYRGCNVSLKNHSGWTALDYAFSNQVASIFKEIIKHQHSDHKPSFHHHGAVPQRVVRPSISLEALKMTSPIYPVTPSAIQPTHSSPHIASSPPPAASGIIPSSLHQTYTPVMVESSSSSTSLLSGSSPTALTSPTAAVHQSSNLPSTSHVASQNPAGDPRRLSSGHNTLTLNGT
ncbi:hypothetical protein BZG36_04694 [Bifiguratus adelaidae]|uniref:Uncharacterized protein n=1 Tax=Bifiguratus adelaidae TaxID=1938954 RepID=A0A261XVK1_9FUNG|nr:hypothetical protein BZG36_04694 [Bifiguratus adelaidae]